LTTFLSPRTADELPLLSESQWAICLGASPYEVNNLLLQEGLIERASIFYHVERRYSSRELQQFLTERSLTTSGRKADLILRLLHVDPEEMASKVANLVLLQCSEEGTRVAGLQLQEYDGANKGVKSSSVLLQRAQSLFGFMAGAAVGGIVENSADRGFQVVLDHVLSSLTASGHTVEQEPESAAVDVEFLSDFQEISRESLEVLLKTGHRERALLEKDEDGWYSLPPKEDVNALIQLYSLDLLRFVGDPEDFGPMGAPPLRRFIYDEEGNFNPGQDHPQGDLKELEGHGYCLTDIGLDLYEHLVDHCLSMLQKGAKGT
jgi:hypothetical protein